MSAHEHRHYIITDPLKSKEETLDRSDELDIVEEQVSKDVKGEFEAGEVYPELNSETWIYEHGMSDLLPETYHPSHVINLDSDEEPPTMSDLEASNKPREEHQQSEPVYSEIEEDEFDIGKLRKEHDHEFQDEAGLDMGDANEFPDDEGEDPMENM